MFWLIETLSRPLTTNRWLIYQHEDQILSLIHVVYPNTCHYFFYKDGSWKHHIILCCCPHFEVVTQRWCNAMYMRMVSITYPNLYEKPDQIFYNTEGLPNLEP